MLASTERNPVVIVTGASAGVGRAVAHRFARAGYDVGLIARDEVSLNAVRQECINLGGNACVAAADVSDPEAVFAAAEAIERELGPVDVWVNDAMETVFSMVADVTPDEFRRVTDVTYLGAVHGSMAALQLMRPRRRGRIVQVGSALAYRGIPLQSAYCGAKHAIRGFTDSLRAEMIHDRTGISVSIVELPAVNTPQFDWARAHTQNTPRPMGTPVQPEVAAAAVFHAAQGNWREYWLGKTTVLTIIGNMVLPGFLDRYLAKNAVAGQQTDLAVAADRADNMNEPITALHRTRGSFGEHAATGALLIPGEVARVGVVVAGAALFFGLGALLSSRLRRPVE